MTTIPDTTAPPGVAASHGLPTASRRWAMVAVAVIGVALIVMPAAFGMFSKAPKGAAMLSQFKPFMTTARLDGFQHELKEINAGVRQTDTTVVTGLDGPGGRAAFDRSYPTFASFDQQWPQIDTTMTTLMNEVQGNLGNYQAMAALPSFVLFPWFFVIPGALAVIVALAALTRRSWWGRARVALVVIGVALIAAPVVFGMFGRGPKGGQMMTAFSHIETTANVQNIQGYFGTMAEGQGAIRLEIVPALESAGLSTTQIRTIFPAVATLDAQWVHILNDMTPMIGAMSDNVSSYQGLKSLPSFSLFPWFFVLPGLMVAGLGLAASRRPRRRASVSASAPTLSPTRPTYQGAS